MSNATTALAALGTVVTVCTRAFATASTARTRSAFDQEASGTGHVGEVLVPEIGEVVDGLAGANGAVDQYAGGVRMVAVDQDPVVSDG